MKKTATHRTDLTEEVLIKLLLKKNISAQTILYNKYRQALYGVIYQILKEDQTISQKALKIAFNKIFNSIHQYDKNKERLFSFLLKITRDTALKIMNDKLNNKSRSTFLTATTIFSKIQKSPSSKKKLQLNDTEQKIIDAIYFKGYTPIKTASLLNLPLKTINEKLHQIIVKIRTTSP